MNKVFCKMFCKMNLVNGFSFKYGLSLVFVLAATMGLAGCGSAGPEPTATPTKTPAGEQAAAVPTATPAPVAQPTFTTPPEPAPAANEEPPADEGASAAEIAVVVNTPILNVRSEPNTSANIVREANQGEQFDVLGRSAEGEWIQLGENGQALGWASADYLQVSADDGSDSTGAPSAEEPATGQPSGPPAGGYLPATMSSPDFGAQAFLWWKPEVAHRDLELMKNGGFSWVKQAFAWETIEGAGKGQYDWSVADRVVRDVNAAGLKLLARVSSDPEKTNFWPGPPPGNAGNFAEFVGALAARYNCSAQAVGCIQAFQIWNEPNLAREWGNTKPNPAQYADFLRQAYGAIKAANPTAIVISAGMAPTGTNDNQAMPDDIYYEQMYQAMGSSNGYFDMLGVHGAGFAAPPELDPAEAAANKDQYGGYRFFAFRHVEDIRAIMERYGDSGKKIVLLEFGWTFDSVNPNYKWHGADAGIDQFVQADYLKRAYQYAAANWPWVGLMSLLTMPNVDWLDDGNPQDEEQYWWAIMDPSPNDVRMRAAFIVLCDYFNEVQYNLYCPYDPDPSRRGSR